MNALGRKAKFWTHYVMLFGSGGLFLHSLGPVTHSREAPREGKVVTVYFRDIKGFNSDVGKLADIEASLSAERIQVCQHGAITLVLSLSNVGAVPLTLANPLDSFSVLLTDTNKWVIELPRVARRNQLRVATDTDNPGEAKRLRLPFILKDMKFRSRSMTKLETEALEVVLHRADKIEVELQIDRVHEPPKDRRIPKTKEEERMESEKRKHLGKIIPVPPGIYRVACLLWLVDASDRKYIRRLESEKLLITVIEK